MSLKRLTPAEMRVMRALWEHPEPEVTVREVCDALTHDPAAGDPPAYSTVKTVMERLVEKGHLATRKRGNVGFFQTLTPAEEAERSTVGAFVDGTLGGLTGPLVNYLTEDADLSDEDVEALERFVAERRAERSRRRKTR